MASYSGHLGYSEDARYPGYRLNVRVAEGFELYRLVIDADSELVLYYAGQPYSMNRPQLDTLWDRYLGWQADIIKSTGMIFGLSATVLPRNRNVDPIQSGMPNDEGAKGRVWVRQLFIGNSWPDFFGPLELGQEPTLDAIVLLERTYQGVIVPTLIELGILPAI